MKPNIPVMIVAAVLAAPVAINAMEQDARTEKADPPRWSEPIVNPAQRQENRLKVAAAALAEAVRDCRGVAERKSCISEARAQHRRDVQAARDAHAQGRS